MNEQIDITALPEDGQRKIRAAIAAGDPVEITEDGQVIAVVVHPGFARLRKVSGVQYGHGNQQFNQW
jgi:hypothetical protein